MEKILRNSLSQFINISYYRYYANDNKEKEIATSYNSVFAQGCTGDKLWGIVYQTFSLGAKLHQGVFLWDPVLRRRKHEMLTEINPHIARVDL